MARRRAGRASASELARTRASIKKRGQESLLAKNIERELYAQVAKKIQGCAVQITNSLAQNGPAWTGEFSGSWDITPAGKPGVKRNFTGGIYEYGYGNFPLKRFTDALDRGITIFNIVNTSDHADVALDFKQSTFYGRGEPVKPVIERGWRPGSIDGQDEHYRGMLDTTPRYYSDGKKIEPNGRITAEADWITKYFKGGFLQRDLELGVKVIF